LHDPLARARFVEIRRNYYKMEGFQYAGSIVGVAVYLKAASPEGVVVVLGFEPGTPLSGGVLSFGWFILQKTDFG